MRPLCPGATERWRRELIENDAGAQAGLREPFEGDFVAEAALVALGVFGVAAVEEGFAELVVGDALVEDVVGGGEDLVAGGDGRFGVPRRLLMRW